MKMTAMMWSSALTLLLAAAATAQGVGSGFTPAVLQDAHAQLAPAMGLLQFSSEVTDPASGEIARRDRNALGVIVSPQGLVMTHGHMILENAEPYNITLMIGDGGNMDEYDVEIVGKPEEVNITFLQIKPDSPREFPYVRFATDSLELGEAVTVFGVLGESLDYAKGLIEARIGAVLEQPRRTYCLDDSLRFGYVGGPVIDTAGRVTGVVGFDLSRAEGGDLYVRSGHPLVYQSALFQRYIDNPDAITEVESGADDAWLGVFTQPLTDEFAEYWGLERNGGLIVSTVVPGSPAAQAGLTPGDVIVQFNGVPIRARQDRDVAAFTKLVREAGAGVKVAVQYLRDGAPQETQITLGSRPRTSQDAAEYEDEIFGLTVRELTTDVRIALNLSEDIEGVIVRRVKSGSPAALAQMRPGVIILAFGGVPVANIDDFQEAIAQVVEARPSEIPVFARVGTNQGFFRLEPRWAAE